MEKTADYPPRKEATLLRLTTVTLNPAMDRMLFVDGLRPGEVQTVLRSRLCAGGKGVNVARILAQLGADVCMTGFVAGRTGGQFLEELAAVRARCDFCRLRAGETRTNTKLYDVRGHCTTDLNEAGPTAEKADAAALLEKVRALAAQSEVLVLSGSVPPGVPADLYAQMIAAARACGCRTILDTAGAALALGAAAGPTLVKPNRQELAALSGRVLDTPAALRTAAQNLLRQGAETVVVSAGSEGAYWFGAHETLFAPVLPVPVAGTVGAGDAMVAGLAFALAQGLSAREAFALGAAASQCCVQTGAAGDVTAADVARMRPRIQVETL